MAVRICIPKLGLTMKEATVGEWLKKEGEYVKKGEPVLEIETDKVNYEIEVEESGYLLKIAAQEGEVLPIGALLGVIGDKDEEIDIPELYKPEAAKVAPAEPSPEAPKPVARGKALHVSHIAEVMAKKHNIDLSKVVGTGPRGRIMKEDVLKAIEDRETGKAIPKELAYRSVPLKGIAKTVSERMSESSRRTAPAAEAMEIDLTKMVNIREERKVAWEEKFGLRITYNDIIVKFTADCLKEFRYLNSSLIEDEIREFEDININIAIDTDRGLIAPVVHQADRKTIPEIAHAIRELSQKAANGSLTLEDMEGGTFTITNLGNLDIELFVPIINYPQCAILGVGKIKKRPIVKEDEIRIASTAYFSVTFDHRITDGAPVGRFLRALKSSLENPFVLEEL